MREGGSEGGKGEREIKRKVYKVTPLLLQRKLLSLR